MKNPPLLFWEEWKGQFLPVIDVIYFDLVLPALATKLL